MNVAVCVKQIPDPAVPGRLDPATRTLVRSTRLVMDDADAYGIEMALQMVDAAGGGEVTLVSMAPGGEVGGLRNGLAMGAHRAVLVSDPLLVGTDALGTAKVLAAAIRRNPFDLVLCATESTDGYTGTMPVQVAEILDLPAVTFATRVEVTGATARVRRQTEAGYDDVEVGLPAVLTLTAGVVEPRYPSFKGIMAAKSKPMDILTLADLNIPAASVGAAGSRQEIVSLTPAQTRKGGEVIEDHGDAHERIVTFLEQLKLI